MRNNIVHPAADELVYEIRQIVAIGKKIEKTGLNLIWENIGDPIAKGECVPRWIKEIISDTVLNDADSLGYSPTQGLVATREYIVNERNSEGGAQISIEDILFFNGLGDAISTVYNLLNKDARVIGPTPAYSTHATAEAVHSSTPYLTYHLDPKNNWYPDIDYLHNQIELHPEIAGILVVNPSNPTGAVYPDTILRQVVDIAKKFDLFIITDEIYSNLSYGGAVHGNLASVIGNVPGMAMRGVSKEFPWPGARCGWIEFYNRDKDPDFARFVKSVIDAKMLEVCSTTLPQKVLPKIMSDERYCSYLAQRNEAYWEKSQRAYSIFSSVPGLNVCKAHGAFYMTILFEDGVLKKGQYLKPANKEAGEIILPFIDSAHLDKCFVYHLLASRGICCVPLSSGFNSDLHGFRITLLESDIKVFEKTMQTIADAAREFLASK